MKIRDSLCLDHFYLGFDSDEFEDLKKLTHSFKRCNTKKVRSGKDQWEGIYLHSNVGSYFEIIADKSKYGIGIAFSAHELQYVDVRKIKQELRNLPWQQKLRLWKTTSRKWFEWLALKPLKSQKGSYEPFYSWIMHYHPLHAKHRVTRPPQSNIDRFESLKITIGEDYKKYINHHTQWLPGQLLRKKTGATLEIYDRDSGSFRIEIKYIKGSSAPKLRSLTMTLCPGTTFKVIQLKFFKLKKSGATLTLEPNTPLPA